MDERTLAILEEANRIYYLMNLDTVAIRVLKSVENLFQRLGVITKIDLNLLLTSKEKIVN